MGLCPSRNRQNAKEEVKYVAPQPPATFESNLRHDADVFVPTPVAKEPWELFLDQKKSQTQAKPFARRADGTYTAEYRKLLDKAARPRPPPGLLPATTAVTADIVRSWKESKPKPKTQLPADPLRAALASRRKTKEEALEELAGCPVAVTHDDLVVAQPPHRHVPFGLSDRHYLSGDEDASKAHVHRSLKATVQREYVSQDISAEVEEAITEVLHQLRLLREAEDKSRRYCVGLREVMRAHKEPGNLKAVLVAPDLDRDTGRGLDAKLQALLAALKKSNTPVIFGLSRRRLGQAIQKNATVSVLGILDTRGVQAPVARMVQLAGH